MQCLEGWVLVADKCFNIAVSTLVIGSILTIFGWIGGWISRVYFENRDRRSTKEHKRKEIEREAIESALRWIDPMMLAIIRAEAASSPFLYGQMDGDNFRNSWPSELGRQLEQLEVPIRLRHYLPSGTMARGVKILAMFYELYYKVLDTDRSNLDRVFEATRSSHNLRKAIENLQRDLEKSHGRTLE